MKKGAQAMQAMKPMKKAALTQKSMKSKRISTIARGKMAKAQVFLGRREKTSGGLTKQLLLQNWPAQLR